MWSLLTKRCYLRDYGEEDREAFLRINTDPVAREHLNGPLSLSEAHQMFETALADTRPFQGARWAIFGRKSNEYLGHVYLVPWEEGRDEMEWGIILKPEHWGRGLASEIGWATLEECFKKRGLHRVMATVDIDHLAALRLLRRLDFVRVGRCEDEAGIYDIYAVEHPGKKAERKQASTLVGAS